MQDLNEKKIKDFTTEDYFKFINLKKIAFNMSMDYKDAKKALDGLIDACVVLEGSDEYTEDGYKFLT